jgi:asparagine synthetase B (glutamine-hydrolysing)
MLYQLIVNPNDGTFQIESIPYLRSSLARIPSEPPEDLLTELESSSTFQNLSTTFLSQLQTAVQRRIINIPSLCRDCKRSTKDTLRPSHGCEHPKLAILFSGGIDSSVLAALADRVLPANEPIDLLNVAFFSGVSAPPADRQTGERCVESRSIHSFV